MRLTNIYNTINIENYNTIKHNTIKPLMKLP